MRNWLRFRLVILTLLISPVLILPVTVLLSSPDPSPETELANLQPDGFPSPYESEGQVFEISNDIYPHLKLESTQPIRLMADTITHTHLSFIISPITTTHGSKSTLTLSGIESFGQGWSEGGCFRYQDGLFVEQYQADASGQITWVQDVKTHGHVYFLPSQASLEIGLEILGQPVPLWYYDYYNYDPDTQTYTLKTDCHFSVVIVADHLTFDGQGHSIFTYSGVIAGYGIYLCYRTGVTIKNCTVSQFNSGIILYWSTGNTIVGNTTYSNYSGINLFSSTHTDIIDNTASLNFGVGIQITGFFPPGGSSYVNVMGNDASSNSAVGILILDSHHITVTANRADAHTFAGIYLGASHNNTLTHNSAASNRGAGSFDPDRCWGGITLSFSHNNVVYANTLDSNDYGMSCLKASNNRIYENDIHDNDYGLNLIGSANNQIYRNNIWNNLVCNASSVDFVFPLPFPPLAMELSYQNQGNWWGRTSEPFFIAGEDTNDLEVTDFYPYALPDAWQFGIDPGVVPDGYVQPHEIVTTIGTGQRPMEIVITPVALPSAWLKAYVLNYGDDTISVIDIPNNKVISTINISQIGLFDVVLTPNGDKAYVSHQDGITVIDVATEQVLHTFSYVGKTFKGLGVNGHHFYALESTLNEIYIFDVVGYKLLFPLISLDFTPHKIAVSPNGLLAYVSHPDDNMVSVVDLISREVVQTLSIVSPYEIAFNQSGDKAYVCSKDPHELVEVDTSTHNILRFILVSGEAMWVAITPDDQFAYVSTKDPSYSVCVVDLTTGEIVKDIPVGEPMYCPAGLAITPDGYDCYVTSENEDMVYVLCVKAHPYLRRVKITEIIYGLGLRGGPITIKGFGFSTVAEENIVHLGVYVPEATVNDTGTELYTNIPCLCCFGTHDVWVETPWGVSNRFSLYVTTLSDVIAIDGPLYTQLQDLYSADISQAGRNTLDQIMRHLFGIGQDEDDENDLISKLRNGQNVAALERIEKAIRLLEQFEKKEGVDTSHERLKLVSLARYILQKLIEDSVAIKPNDLAKIEKAEEKLEQGTIAGSSGEYLKAGHEFKTGAAKLTKFQPKIELGTPTIDFVEPEPWPKYLGLDQSFEAVFKVENKNLPVITLVAIEISHTPHTTIEYRDKVIPPDKTIDKINLPFTYFIIGLGGAFIGKDPPLTITGTNVSTTLNDARIEIIAHYYPGIQIYYGIPWPILPTKSCSMKEVTTVVEVEIENILSRPDNPLALNDKYISQTDPVSVLIGWKNKYVGSVTPPVPGVHYDWERRRRPNGDWTVFIITDELEVEFKENRTGDFDVRLVMVKGNIRIPSINTRRVCVTEVEVAPGSFKLKPGGNYTKDADNPAIVHKPPVGMTIEGIIRFKQNAPQCSKIKQGFIQAVKGQISIKREMTEADFDWRTEAQPGDIVKYPEWLGKNYTFDWVNDAPKGSYLYDYTDPAKLGLLQRIVDIPGFGPDAEASFQNTTEERFVADILYTNTGHYLWKTTFTVWLVVLNEETHQYMPLKQQSWELMIDTESETGPWKCKALGQPADATEKPTDHTTSAHDYTDPDVYNEFGPIQEKTKPE